jgi:hypothetical protein
VSGPHLVPSIRLLLLWDICGLHVVGPPPQREDGSVIYSYNSLSLSDPSPAELMTTSGSLVCNTLNLEGQIPIFISRRNRVAQLYPQALGYLFLSTSYDSQGYSGGILTCLHMGKKKTVAQSQSQSHIMTNGQSVRMSWRRVHCGTSDQI